MTAGDKLEHLGLGRLRDHGRLEKMDLFWFSD